MQEEREFCGGLTRQVRNCLQYLYGQSPVYLRKEPERIEARRWRAYPEVALRETLVNALYHRGYEPDVLEPTKVYLYPDRVEIISYPGPVPGVDAEHFSLRASFPAVPARNRRIGEFLKELGLAEARLTGLRKVAAAMAANGSPAPRYDFDGHRTYFRATLPAHPEYVALSAVRDAAELRALGDQETAHRLLESAWESNRASAALAAELIRSHAARGDLEQADSVLAGLTVHATEHALREVTEVLAAVRHTRRDC